MRLNLPQFTADFPRFRMLPGNLTSSDQIPPARTNGKKTRVGSRPSFLALRFFTNAYVCKPRADLEASELSPVLFNACLKLIKAGRTSLVPADPQSELRVSMADTTALSTPGVYAFSPVSFSFTSIGGLLLQIVEEQTKRRLIIEQSSSFDATLIIQAIWTIIV